MSLRWQPWTEQQPRWPAEGRWILAQHDDVSVVVYQAFTPSIAAHAVSHQRLDGGGFSRSRMSWIKPNFLWMMFRCGWATKAQQERVLAVRLRREGFDAILARAVPSSWDRARYPARSDWEAAVARSDVRLQWDPDHDPSGAPLPRRAVQLGLRGETLGRYLDVWTLGIDDITDEVHAQRRALREGGREVLVTPEERPYVPGDPAVRAALGLDG